MFEWHFEGKCYLAFQINEGTLWAFLTRASRATKMTTLVEQITVRIVQIMIQATDLAQILFGGNNTRKKRGPRKILIWPPFFKMAAMGYL